VLNSANARWRLSWILLASLVFYGWWNPVYVPLLISSIVVNYLAGTYLATAGVYRRAIMIAGIAFNLGLLGFFKYAGFIAFNVNALPGVALPVPSIVLPLAISFFTFQQIAFLVDAYRGIVGRVAPLNYAVFVSFFPQLIAGPIVHHKEMMPQFAQRQQLVDASRLASALSIFTIGLFKKTVIADGLAPTANLVFSQAENGSAMSALEAATGTLSYSFQLYFDFSGYSDMAIGLALLIGIRLPVNFRSPYKAASITEFWRCWHITLSRFLRDYLYIPLGGNRKGRSRRYVNIMITMLLGGLWHGAGWTFAIWGALHGVLLLVHQFWQTIAGPRLGVSLPRPLATAITFVAVAFCWIFFRAETLDGALNIVTALTHLGAAVSSDDIRRLFGTGTHGPLYTAGLLALAFAVAFGAPNAASYHLDQNSTRTFRADIAHLLFIVGLWVGIVVTLGASSEFLYFQF
ncbi:MAG: MBOAT family O-acyltransferase, partial [Aestuariivirgaceae bacterium]